MRFRWNRPCVLGQEPAVRKLHQLRSQVWLATRDVAPVIAAGMFGDQPLPLV